MNVRYVVELTIEEREELEQMLAGGELGARKLKRAQVLLGSDRGLTDAGLSEALGVGTSTIYRTKRRYVEGGLAHALSEKQRPGARRKLSGREEALLVATACSKPPAGRAKWTMELLADEIVRLTDHDELSSETVRRRLKENQIKPWQKRMWCIPYVNPEFVARMEDVLDLYTGPADPNAPVVCFDESPVQLVEEKRAPIPAKEGQTERYDYEYRRMGVANLFVFVDAHRPWREVKVTEQRTRFDFALCMRDLVDVHYPDAEKVRVVMDNLSTHRPGALYETFEPDEARRILRRLEFHFTPKHASWLNMVELEIGFLSKQCLDRRIPDIDTLEDETCAWVEARNASGARIEWLFSAADARRKMGTLYPAPIERPEPVRTSVAVY